MRCGSCATELIPGKRFCHACGAPASGSCPSCGAAIGPGFRFCPDCGHALEAAEAGADRSPPRGESAAPPAEPGRTPGDDARSASGASPAGGAATSEDPRQPARPAADAQPGRPAADAQHLERLRRQLPASLAEKLRAMSGSGGGERKRVTVVFCDIAGSTEIADRLDAEEYRDVLGQYVELCLEEIYRFEGIVNQLAGDGMMALFGAPIAHEDAPERAIRAALAIRARLVRFNETVLAKRDFELKARFGINTGPVVVGTVGNDLKMDYTATGDTTNLASRLESLAAPNAILVSAATERLVRGRFELRDVGPLQVKGKRNAVAAYEVLGTIDDANAMSLAASRGLTRLVGRDEELAQLEACYARLHGHLSQVVAIVGEAGSGKSRLIYELKQHLARELPIVLEARCSSLSQMLGFSPWSVMLRQFFGLPLNGSCEDASEIVRRGLAAIDESLVPLEPRISHMFRPPATTGSPESPEESKTETFEAVSRLVMALSRKTPVVMIFEDLHWIDDPSREMLEIAASRLRSTRVMLLVSHRPEYEPHWRVGAAFTHLQLRPLSDDLATTMIRAVAGGELPPELEERIRARGEGNPFFLEEMTRAILEEGSLLLRGGRMTPTRPVAEMLIPETVQEVIGARLDRLPPAAKRTAQVAAVLGRQFRRDQLTALLEGEGIEVASELDELEHRGIVHRKSVLSEAEFRFGESVTQELAYESLLVRERRVLHGRIARLLEEASGEAPAEQSALLAHHYARSEDRGKAIDALLRAAADAERVPSYQATREFYRAAWTMCAGVLDGSTDDVVRRQAMHAALGLCHMSVVYVSAGDMDEIERVAQHGRELAEALGDRLAAASFASYRGLAVMSVGPARFREGLGFVEQAFEEARRFGAHAHAVNISRGLAWAYLFDGRFALARRTIEEALAELESVESRERPGKPSDLYFGVRFMSNSILFQCDEIAAAIRATRETHELALRHQNRTIASASASTLAQAHFSRGEYEEAVSWADTSLAIASELGNLAAGRPAAAVALASRAALGLVAPPGRHLRIIESGLAGATNLPLYVTVLVEALLAVGESRRAEACLDHAERHAGGRLRTALNSSARAMLLCHDPRRAAEAAQHAARAIELAEEIDARSTLALALLTMGQISAARGDRSGALLHLERAVPICRALDLGHYLRRADALLADLAPAPVAEQPEA